jgi:hypothetical protein
VILGQLELHNYVAVKGRMGMESRILKCGELRYNNIIRDNIPENFND